MRAIRKRPGEAPEIVDVENTLEALQAEVGGQIESLRFAADDTVLCNEEGKLMKLAPNIHFMGDVLCGTILVVGVKGEAFCSLSMRNTLILREFMGSERLWRS